MRTQINLKTSIKRNDNRIVDKNLPSFIVGKLTNSTWSWNKISSNENIEASEDGTIYIFMDGFGDSFVKKEGLCVALKAMQNHFEKIKNVSSLCLDINREIKIAFLEAHHAIIEDAKANSQQKESVTNVFLAWMVEGQLYAGWNSECNFYAIQNGILELLDYEAMNISSSLDFESTALLTNHQYIGSEKNPPKIKTLKNAINLGEIDRLLFCSYQFHRMVAGATIERILRDEETHEMTLSALVHAANLVGGLTNNSLWLIDRQKNEEEDDGKTVLKKRYLFPFLALIIATGVGFISGSQFSSLELKKGNSEIRTASIPITNSVNNLDNQEIPFQEKLQIEVRKEMPKPKKIPKKKTVVAKDKEKVVKVRKKELTGRMKMLEEKVIKWNDNKFLLLKKMNALEAFLSPSSPEALKELNTLKARRTQLNSGLVEIIQLDKNRKPVYDENNQVYLSINITQETVEQKFWKLHNQLKALEEDLKKLCKKYYCKDLIK